MNVVNLSEQPSLESQYLAEMRDTQIHTDPLRVRRNLERLGEIMAYEISRTLDFSAEKIKTPLGVEADCNVIADKIVLATIFRAGIPFHQGFLRYFDNAENAFVSAYRKYKEKENFDVLIEYLATPRLEGKTLVICDPMLATGASMELSYRALLTKGTPAKLHIASVIASQKAVDYMNSVMPEDATLWVGVIDPEINAHSYIVPGLGDAGDLAYGVKE